MKRGREALQLKEVNTMVLKRYTALLFFAAAHRPEISYKDPRLEKQFRSSVISYRKISKLHLSPLLLFDRVNFHH